MPKIRKHNNTKEKPIAHSAVVAPNKSISKDAKGTDLNTHRRRQEHKRQKDKSMLRVYKLTERAKLQNQGISKPDPHLPKLDESRGAIDIKIIERDGELLFAIEDWGDRHDRRVQRAAMSECDRLFWVTIAIACGTPDIVSDTNKNGLDTTEKKYGKLEKARNDLDAIYQYYRPMKIGSPDIVGMTPGLGKSPGFFDYAIHLNNPTVQQLQISIHKVRKWIEINQYDPEYTSFQLNFFFSGHGKSDGSIVLADKELAASELTSILLSSIPKHELCPAPCRLDLFLDCCHSGAIAHDFQLWLTELQQEAHPLYKSFLEIGQAYCSCLDDEASFELNNAPHSIFTFAFLNECSRKQPDGIDATNNYGLRDIGWITKAKGGQHPLLLDFTDPKGIRWKFPAMYYLTHQSNTDVNKRMVVLPIDIDFNVSADDPIGDCLRISKSLREECNKVEQDLQSHPKKRIPFSREELFTNTRFPFL